MKNPILLYFLLTLALGGVGYVLSDNPAIFHLVSIYGNALLSLLSKIIDPSSIKDMFKKLRTSLFFVCILSVIFFTIFLFLPTYEPFRPSKKGPDFLTYVIDNSGSMGYKGEQINNKHRVDYAKEWIAEDIKKFEVYGKISLIEIGGSSNEGECNVNSIVNTEITSYHTMLTSLDKIKANDSGASNISGAIAKAVNDILDSEKKLSSGNKSKEVVIITDLGQNCGSFSINEITSSIKQENLTLENTKKILNNVVVFALSDRKFSDSLNTESDIAYASSLTANKISASQESININNEIKSLKSQGIRVFEIGDYKQISQLEIPNKTRDGLLGFTTLPLMFWGINLLISLLIFINSRFRRKQSKLGGNSRTKIPPKKMQSNISSDNDELENNNNLYNNLNNDNLHDGINQNPQHRINDINAIKDEDSIQIELTWNYSRAQPYLRLWLELQSSPKILIDSREPDIIEGAKMNEKNQTGGPTIASITGNSGVWKIFIENYYEGKNKKNVNPIYLSRGVIKISRQNIVQKEFNCPESGDGNCWYVCSIDLSSCQITEINSIIKRAFLYKYR